MEFAEPFYSEFIELIRAGAGSQDMHGMNGFDRADYAAVAIGDDAMIRKELARVDLHRRSLCALLAEQIRNANHILDVGCGTGATSIAMALSAQSFERVVGVDPSGSALTAAQKRAQGYGLADRVSFLPIVPSGQLPFTSNSFDLTICVSVLEFIPGARDRAELVREIVRVTKPGGSIAIFTTNNIGLREHHSRRWFGNIVRRNGFPWPSSRRQLRKMLIGCDVRFLGGEQLAHAFRNRRLPGARVVARLPWVGVCLPWQKIVAQKFR